MRCVVRAAYCPGMDPTRTSELLDCAKELAIAASKAHRARLYAIVRDLDYPKPGHKAFLVELLTEYEHQVKLARRLEAL